MWERWTFSKKLHVEIIQELGTDGPFKIFKENDVFLQTLGIFHLTPLSRKLIFDCFNLYLSEFYFSIKFQNPKR